MDKKISVYSYSDRNIIILDEIAMIFFSTIQISYYTELHTAICIAISVVIGLIMYVFFLTRIGFWVISIIFSLIWSTAAYFITQWLSKDDKTWMWVVAIFAFIIFMSLHASAKRFSDNVDS